MKKKNKEKDVAINKTLEIMKIRKYDEKLEAFILDDKSFFDILELTPKDRDNLQDDEISFDIAYFTIFLRLYNHDLKLISLNFPLDTGKQKKFLEYKLENTENPVKRKWLEREIYELEMQKDIIKRKEFYLMYFADTEDNLLRNRSDIENSFTSSPGFIREMSKNKKIEIVRKLNNMNAPIGDIVDEEYV